MNSRILLVNLVLGLAIVCPAVGPAPSSAASRSVSFYAFGGYQRYAMSDVNQIMKETLAAYPGSRADKEEIKDGRGWGAGMRVWPTERVFVSLEFQRLLASNSGTGSYAGSTYAVDLDVPASSVATSVGYVVTPRSRFRAGLAAGVGYYSTTGRLSIVGPGLNVEPDLEGSGFGAHGFGFVLAGIARNVQIEADAGYRYSKTTDVTANGSRYRNADGSLATIDWSGFIGRAGLTVTVPGR